MASPSASWFSPFEGTRNPYPLAIFRIAFFGGLALHFFPALWHLDDAYRPGALRSQEWSHWLYVHFSRIPHGALRAFALVTMLGCVAGIVGLRPRLAAIVSGIGLYSFASFNSLPVQTLAIVDAWGILLLWMICGGGSAALSVDALLARKATPAREPGLLPALALFQILLAVFFAGIEKVLAGWPGTNEMHVVLSYPKGFVVRDWVWSSPWMHSTGVTFAFSCLTLAVELGTPILLLWRRTRMAALFTYQAFFLGIIAMLEVPPLFYAMFAFGALLALDDAEVDLLSKRLLRRRAR